MVRAAVRILAGILSVEILLLSAMVPPGEPIQAVALATLVVALMVLALAGVPSRK
jgi:hypothetical protein